MPHHPRTHREDGSVTEEPPIGHPVGPMPPAPEPDAEPTPAEGDATEAGAKPKAKKK
jgi:hypothetical protein